MPKADSFDGLTEKATSGAIWTLLEMGGSQGLSLVFFAVLARIVSPRDFGLMSICFVALTTMRLLIQDKIPEAVAVKQNAEPIEWTTAFWLSAAAGLGATGIIVACAHPIAQFLGIPGLAPILSAMSLMVFFCGLGRTHEIWLNRHFMNRSLALRGIGGSVIGGVVGIVAALQGAGVYALVLQQVAASIAALALLWRTTPWRPTLRWSLPACRHICAYLRDTVGGGLISAVNQNCDTFLIALFYGPITAGFFSVAKRLRLSLQLVSTTPIVGVILPYIAEIKGDLELTRVAVERSIRTVSFICAPIYIGAMVVAPEAIDAFFGRKWHAAAPMFAALAFAGLGQALQLCAIAVILTHQRPRWSVYMSLLESGLTVLGFVILSSWFDCSVAIWAFAIPVVIVVPVTAALALRLLHLPLAAWWRMLYPGLSMALLMAIPVTMLSRSGIIVDDYYRLGCMCVAGALIWFGLLRILDPSLFKEGFSRVQARLLGAKANRPVYLDR